MTAETVFLKLGGSLITDKDQPGIPRLDVIARLAGEIAAARRAAPGLRLVLGHGSGSFGHVPANKYGTRQGVRSPAEWLGFVEVWREAAALNRLVMDALAAAGLPALAFPPSAAVLAEDGRLTAWQIAPLVASLEAGLLPVVYGDVVFDTQRGGTILSTEDLFDQLAIHLKPRRLLLAGLEPGVWADFPACTRLVERITPADLPGLAGGLGGSAAVDVTGGMRAKVEQCLSLAAAVAGLEAYIFSGLPAGNALQALSGESIGTRITAAG
jgi:isopentenyl phosphate kinase